MESNLSSKLRELRKMHGYSTDDVLNKLKNNFGLQYSEQSIYKWESGAVTPDIEVLAALAKIYRCNVSYLLATSDVEYKNLTPYELFVLKIYRSDSLFKLIADKTIDRLERQLIVY